MRILLIVILLFLFRVLYSQDPYHLTTGETIFAEFEEVFGKRALVLAYASTKRKIWRPQLTLVPFEYIENRKFTPNYKAFNPGRQIQRGANHVLLAIGVGLSTFAVSQLDVNVPLPAYWISSGVSTGLVIYGFSLISKNARYIDVRIID